MKGKRKREKKKKTEIQANRLLLRSTGWLTAQCSFNMSVSSELYCTSMNKLDSELASWLATSIMRARRCETGLLKSYISHVTDVVVCSRGPGSDAPFHLPQSDQPHQLKERRERDAGLSLFPSSPCRDDFHGYSTGLRSALSRPSAETAALLTNHLRHVFVQIHFDTKPGW